MHVETRFCTVPDGVALAYAIEGQGPPLIKACNWMTHLDVSGKSASAAAAARFSRA